MTTALLIILIITNIISIINLVSIKHRIDYYLKNDNKNYDKDKYGID